MGKKAAIGNTGIVGKTPEERLVEFQKNYACFFWKPYPWQERAIEVVHSKNLCAPIASNKIGKCLTYQTLISTPSGEISIGRLFKNGQPFDVYAWDGSKKVVAKAFAPFKKKGIHKCYRVIMSDGRWFEAADHHKVLTSSGWTSIQDVLLLFSKNHHVSNGVFYHLVHDGDGRRLIQKQLDCPDCYSVDSYLNGEQLHRGLNSDPILLPLQYGFQEYILSLLQRGVLVEKYKYILSGLASLLCRGIRFWGRLVEFLFQAFCTSVQRMIYAPQGYEQHHVGAFFGFLLNPLIGSHIENTLPSYSTPIYIDGNKIVSYTLIGSQEVYDFEVEKYHNYFAGGVIHHNSALGANVVISWALGYEPWRYVEPESSNGICVGGQWYHKSSLGIEPPVNIIITGEDWKLHLGRVIVPELIKWAPRGWYTTKSNEQGVEYYWTWNNKSTFTLMSYTQDDDLFESFRAQGAWEDEPPPKSKHTALSRGLLLDNGKTLMTLTPLKEAWILDDIVLSGRRDIGIVGDLKITDNPDLYNSDVAVLRGMGLSDVQIDKFFDLLLYEDKEKGTPVIDQGSAAEKFLEEILVAA